MFCGLLFNYKTLQSHWEMLDICINKVNPNDAFARHFSKLSDLNCIQDDPFLSVDVFPGNRTHDLGVAKP